MIARLKMPIAQGHHDDSRIVRASVELSPKALSIEFAAKVVEIRIENLREFKQVNFFHIQNYTKGIYHEQR